MARDWAASAIEKKNPVPSSMLRLLLPIIYPLITTHSPPSNIIIKE